ncbi:MAG: hypothetical protein CVT86_06815, partial [Alphaproteobacteria bacterium HGW-Alphaproteobacteria-8]
SNCVAGNAAAGAGNIIVPDAGTSGEFYIIERAPKVAGENLVDASAGFDQDGRPAVNFRFDTTGARQFGDYTRQNVGKIFAIVLTIGMAVDANVLVFERIREELKRAKGVARAIEAGYERALSAIIDANITTFIAAAILFAMGSGPVKGFAVTLGVGVVTSVFTAILVTRLIVASWFARAQPKALAL